ncbi:unnamed protein product [Polarella glacialis]|uniref:Prolow-density lipoprotein receptor-related protein 1-like beta-propeller domain-containing protein n=1 Tax=Polarella glacialis TaxID=89957 RepID=A0A813JH00_POLGL|nr:unnamed protein product [Polarella glacialis]
MKSTGIRLVAMLLTRFITVITDRSQQSLANVAWKLGTMVLVSVAAVAAICTESVQVAGQLSVQGLANLGQTVSKSAHIGAQLPDSTAGAVTATRGAGSGSLTQNVSNIYRSLATARVASLPATALTVEAGVVQSSSLSVQDTANVEQRSGKVAVVGVPAPVMASAAAQTKILRPEAQATSNVAWPSTKCRSSGIPASSTLSVQAQSMVGGSRPQCSANATRTSGSPPLAGWAALGRVMPAALQMPPQHSGQNLSNALQTLGKAASPGLAVIDAAWAASSSGTAQPASQNTSNAAWWLTAASHLRVALMAVLATSAPARADCFSEQDLTNSIWSLATARFEQRRLFGGIPIFAVPRAGNIGPQGPANALRQCTTSLRHDKHLITAVAIKLSGREALDTQDLSNATWGSRKLSLRGKLSMHSTASAGPSTVSAFGAQGLSNLGQAHAKCLTYHEALPDKEASNALQEFGSAATHGIAAQQAIWMRSSEKLRGFCTQDLSNASWGCGTSSAWGWSPLGGACQRALRMCPGQELSSLLSQDAFDLSFSLLAFSWSFAFAAQARQAELGPGPPVQEVAAWSDAVCGALLRQVTDIGRQLDRREGDGKGVGSGGGSGSNLRGYLSWTSRMAPTAQGAYAATAWADSPLRDAQAPKTFDEPKVVAMERGMIVAALAQNQVLAKPVNWEVDGLSAGSEVTRFKPLWNRQCEWMCGSVVQALLPRSRSWLVHNAELDYGFVHRLDVRSLETQLATGEMFVARQQGLRKRSVTNGAGKPARTRKVLFEASSCIDLCSSAPPQWLSVPLPLMEPVRSKLYIVVNFPHRILRSNLDGSDMEVLVDDVTYPLALAVDQVHHKLYFSVSDDRSDRIIRSDLDGSNREVLIEGPLAHAIAVDPTLGRLYWSDNSGYRIQSARLDGTDVQDLVSELDEPACVGLDPKAGKLYWCDQGAASEVRTGKVQRSNLDGSAIEDVASNLSHPMALALDVDGDKLYWSDAGSFEIRRSNLDGSGVDALSLQSELDKGVARGLLDPHAARKLYWTLLGTVYAKGNAPAAGRNGKLQRANLDGTDVEDIAEFGSTQPVAVVVVLAAGLKAGGLQFPVSRWQLVAGAIPDEQPADAADEPTSGASSAVDVAVQTDRPPAVSHAVLDSIWVSEFGEKYHRTPECRGLEGMLKRAKGQCFGHDEEMSTQSESTVVGMGIHVSSLGPTFWLRNPEAVPKTWLPASALVLLRSVSV